MWAAAMVLILLSPLVVAGIMLALALRPEEPWDPYKDSK